MPLHLDGVVWIVVSLAPLMLLQRLLQKEIQLIFLFLTRRVDLSLTLFSVLFFPGVLLHEGSHYLAARILGVSTGRFSLLPQPAENGKLRLGYVETAPTDWFRDALIGSAPLIAGGAFVGYAGIVQLGLLSLTQALLNQGLEAFNQTLNAALARSDFWLWFYLALVVSSTMLPSASDRQAWLPLGVILGALLGLSLVLGAGPWLAENLAEPFNRFLKAVSIVFAISAGLHLVLLPFVWLVRKALERVLRLEVVI